METINHRFNELVYNIKIKKIIKFCFFIICFIIFQNNKMTQIISHLFLLFYSTLGIEQLLRSLVITFLLSIINTNIGLPPSQFSIIIRWGLLFLSFSRIVFYQIKYKVFFWNKSFSMFILFLIVNIISSLFLSVNIYVSIMKLVSFSIGMYIFFIGITITNPRKWREWIFYIFLSFNLLSISLLLIPNIGFYYRNMNLFTGLINHPNIYGALSVCTLAYYIYYFINCFKSKRLFLVLLTILTYVSIILSKARGAILVASLILICFFIFYFLRKKTAMKLIIFNCILITALIYCSYNFKSIQSNIKEIIYKGDTTEVFASRESQFERVLEPFFESPLIGKGFGVDENNIVENTNLLSSPTEKGNIIFGILSESGIVGLILFILFNIIFLCEFSTKENMGLKLVILSFIFTNMTEVTYFSMSNIGFINCMLMGLYFALGMKKGG